ncbi:MAG TPA: hypothetical protein VM555_06495 [Tahibacter sp.]|nr:hypothetical protein [Tahibacter sp.]
MIAYANLSGDSPIIAYRCGADYIDIAFRDAGVYRYTRASAGAHRVAAMKRLAAAGRGLAAFIAREAHDRYAEKRD